MIQMQFLGKDVSYTTIKKAEGEPLNFHLLSKRTSQNKAFYSITVQLTSDSCSTIKTLRSTWNFQFHPLLSLRTVVPEFNSINNLPINWQYSAEQTSEAFY